MNIRDFDKFINVQTLKKGSLYYKNGKISQPIYLAINQTFTASVSGTIVYETSATIHEGEIIKHHCSCLATDLCKHVVGLMIAIKEDETLLKLTLSSKLSENTVQKKQVYPSFKYELITEDDYKAFFDYMIKIYQESLEDNKVQTLVSYFDSIKSHIHNEAFFAQHMYEGFERLLVVFKKEDLEVLLEAYFSHEQSSYHFNVYHNQMIESHISDDLGQIYAKVLLKKKPAQFKTLHIDSRLKTSLFLELMKSENLYHLIFLKPYEFMKADIIALNKAEGVGYPFLSIEKFIINPNLTTLRKMYEILDKSLIETIMTELKIKPVHLRDALEFKKEIGYQFNYQDFEIDFKIVSSLYELIKEVDLKNFSTYIKAQLDNEHFYYQKIDESELLKIMVLFDMIDDIILNDRYKYKMMMLGLFTSQYALLIKKGGLPKQLAKVIQRIGTKSYHQPRAEFVVILESHEKDFIENITIMRIEKNNSDVYFKASIKKGVFIVEDAYQYKAQHALNILREKSTLETEVSFKDIQDNLYEKRRQAVSIKKQAESLRLVEYLSELVVANDKVLLSDKVFIRPILVLDYQYDKEQFHLVDYPLIGLKIGTGKDYIIKNIEHFLNAIDREETVQYGKNLVFKHYLEQFDQRSQKIIQVLGSYQNIGMYKSYQALLLPLQKLGELLDIVKEIYIIDQPSGLLIMQTDIYQVTDAFEVSIEATARGFKLNFEEEMKYGVSMIRHLKFDLLLNSKYKTVSKIKYLNEKQRKLTHFILDNPQFEFEHVKDKFVTKVVPFIKDEALIENELNELSKKYALKIQSYFDYDRDKDQIIVKHHYFEADKQIFQVLDTPAYEMVIQNYDKVLNQFGIYENKIKHQQDILLFITADLTPMKKHAEVYVSDTLSHMRIKKLPKMSIHVKMQEGMLKTHIGETTFDEKSLKKILGAYKEGKKYILLKDEVILVDTEEVKALSDFTLYHDMDINQLSDTYSHPMYHLFKFDHQSEYLTVEIEDRLKNIMINIRNYRNKEIKVYPSTYTLLKSYQIEGLKWLLTLYEENMGGILADDMGLGKTLQVISLLESIQTERPLLVVCPKSLVYNWAHELIKFKANFKHMIYVGTKEERDFLFDEIKNSSKKLLVIISYDTLRNDIESFKRLMFDTIILDEAQHIKTIKAQKTLAVKEINAVHKFVLTGTPLENAISDLWSIFDFLMPGYLYHYGKFKSFEIKATESDKEALGFIIDKTKPFILRRTKREVLKELPDKTEELIYTSFDEKEQHIYDAYLLEVKKKLENPSVTKFDLLADLTKLRQLCISPRLLYPTYRQPSSKIEIAVELIKSAIASGHKVLVFSSFVKALELIKNYFIEEAYFMLTGTTEAKDRVLMTSKFNKESSRQKVFFISLKAGGTGLNLTGADIVIHLDPWWNLAAENQATDRAHRIGQKQKVTVYKMIMNGSIEEKVIELQEKKKELFDKIIDSKEIAHERMGVNEYRFLLE